MDRSRPLLGPLPRRRRSRRGRSHGTTRPAPAARDDLPHGPARPDRRGSASSPPRCRSSTRPPATRDPAGRAVERALLGVRDSADIAEVAHPRPDLVSGLVDHRLRPSLLFHQYSLCAWIRAWIRVSVRSPASLRDPHDAGCFELRDLFVGQTELGEHRRGAASTAGAGSGAAGAGSAWIGVFIVTVPWPAGRLCNCGSSSAVALSFTGTMGRPPRRTPPSSASSISGVVRTMYWSSGTCSTRSARPIASARRTKNFR